MKVIHGSYDDETQPSNFKTCPVCGAVCFEDMDVCFGCLHQFNAEESVGEAKRKSVIPQNTLVPPERVEHIRIHRSEEGRSPSANNERPGGTTTKQVCADDQGREFEITVSIRML